MEEPEIFNTLFMCGIAAVGVLGVVVELYQQNKADQLEQQKKQGNLTKLDNLLRKEYVRCKDFNTPDKQQDLLNGLELIVHIFKKKTIQETEYQQVSAIAQKYNLNRASQYLSKGVHDE